MNQPQTILVIGSTGKTGRRVAELLANKGTKVRAGSRGSQPPFDWEDPSTWEPAVTGVDGAYITFFPDLAFPGGAEAVETVAKLAVKNGVRKLVLLSGRGEEGAQRGEDAVRASGADWTVVRASWFCQNFSEGHFVDGVRAGEVAFPGGSVAEPFIDVDDIADIVVAALTDSKHSNKLYEVSGPRLMTFADAVAEISKAVGRSIRYVPITPDQYAAMLIEHQVPADFAHGLADVFATILDGRNAHLSDGVQQALGRPPRDFTDFARKAAESGVWTQR